LIEDSGASGHKRSAFLGWWRGLGSASPRLSLALQGGGAHGAFTWGVLDRLLEDPRVEFDGLSGSSAGAMNAVVMAQGWMAGGRDGARQALSDFWSAVGRQMPIGMVTQGEGDTIALSPASKLLAHWAGWFTPSQLNPLALNPLRDLVQAQVDFERLRSNSPFKLFVGATQVNTGCLRIFREGELTADMLMASACLPRIHHAVEIDGQPYWDGGYSANPAVFPLFYGCESRDVLLVLLSPLAYERTPGSIEEIEARAAELAFSTHFLREMDWFARATEFAGPTFLVRGRLERRLRAMRFHMIDIRSESSLQRTETKLIAHPPFLELLRDRGRAQAGAWLLEHFESVGRHSTLDIGEAFACH
jgi:NTE family protein